MPGADARLDGLNESEGLFPGTYLKGNEGNAPAITNWKRPRKLPAFDEGGKDADPSIVERQVLPARQINSHVRRWARLNFLMLLSPGYIIGCYWRLWINKGPPRASKR